MQVIAGDVFEHVGRAGVYGHAVADGVTERPGSLAIDEDAIEFVAREESPLHHQISLRDEPAFDIAARKLAPLPQGVVPEALEDEDARVVGLGDVDTGHDDRG